DRVLSAWISSSSTDIRWLVTDQLGTPRMIFDQSGSLSSVSRHDYLPYGEELFADTGGRTTTQGYTASAANPADGARQKFTGYEADAETGLNFAQARYQSSSQGRFTSPDPFAGSATIADPQTFNRYAYVGNNPVNRNDPSGLAWTNDASQRGFSQNYYAQGNARGLFDGEGGDHAETFPSDNEWVLYQTHLTEIFLEQSAQVEAQL